jgi:hypothetical protein
MRVSVAVRLRPRGRAPAGHHLCLHPLPEISFDDCRVLSGVGLILVADASDIDRVGQEVMQLATGEGRCATHQTRPRDPRLGSQSQPRCLGFDQTQVAEVIIKAEELVDDRRLGRID